MQIAYKALDRYANPVEKNSLLVVCGGVGGEATFFCDRNLRVTTTDFSLEALLICGRRDPRPRKLVADAEKIPLQEDSVDIVLVQDGLHELRRPMNGLTEMLRVARRAVVVIEPHRGIVGRLFGREWEQHKASTNYVFRWDGTLVTQVTNSYLLNRGQKVRTYRFWDHNLAIGRLVSHLPRRWRLFAARVVYALFWIAAPLGNMMVCVVCLSENDGPCES